MPVRLGSLGWALVALLSAGVALYAFHYLLPSAVAPPGIAENPFARPWLVVHASLAATAMLIGPFQLVPWLRARRPRLHRWTGRAYVSACLVGGSAALLLALGSTAGPIATPGFGLLALVWMTATAQAWRMALARRFDEHRRWMLRSFALTFAAVTLRLYLPIVFITGLPYIESYRAISFLCWVPNLLAMEFYLRRRPLQTVEPARA